MVYQRMSRVIVGCLVMVAVAGAVALATARDGGGQGEAAPSRGLRAISDEGPSSEVVSRPTVQLPDPRSQSSTKGATMPPGWDGGRDGLPDCIPVHNKAAETVGCAKKDDVFPPGPNAEQALQPQTNGLPVYDLSDQQQVVGYLPGGIGFVPSSLMPQLSEIRQCYASLAAVHTSQSAEPLSSDCVDLLSALGVPEERLP